MNKFEVHPCLLGYDPFLETLCYVCHKVILIKNSLFITSKPFSTPYIHEWVCSETCVNMLILQNI